MTRARAADERRSDLAERYRVLAETIGAKVEELQRRLADARRTRDESETRLERLRRDRDHVNERKGAARSAVTERRDKVAERDARRLEAFEELQRLGRTGVWSILGPDWRDVDVDEAWSPTRGIEVARELDKELADTDDDDRRWQRAVSLVQRGAQELMTSLSSYGLSPQVSNEADILVVTTLYQGQPLGPDALARTLNDEIEQRTRILDEREREILENHLLSDVASHLHRQIRDAEALVREMNREIESRPLSTGMRLRFQWSVRDDEMLSAVRKRLLSAQGVWSPEDRDAIGRFLQQRIQDERAASQTGTWFEHLARALDYREWHEFQIQRYQNQSWKRLTKRTYGTGSGGEKAIALTLPQLAAAAAHYRGASPHAPRLILMDEAFVGVDSDMRAKCMGLLAAFDLDFVMTSEREWGCYETVPGLAIYHLVTRPGLDAVHETRWVWNGRDLTRDDGSRPVETASGAPAAPVA